MTSQVPEPDHIVIDTEMLCVQVRDRLINKLGPVPELISDQVYRLMDVVVIATVKVLIEELELGHAIEDK